MRTRLRSKVTLLFMMCAVLLAIPAMALADTLQINNTLVVGSNVSKDPGQSGTGTVWLDPSDNSTDPQNGCNATDPAPVTVTFTSSDTSKIANPEPITLTGCGTNAAKDFSYNVAPSATAGTVQISGAVSGGRGGTYNTNDTLTVTINAPAKQNTAISNVSGSGTYGGNSTLTAKLSSGANNLSGKYVAFELNGQAVGTDATDANGVAELSGVSLSGINAGTYNNAVSANFVGDSAYDGSSGSGNLSVAKADATFDVTGYTGVYDGDAHGATGTATGINGEDLGSLLHLGESFTNVPGGTAHWTFDGDGNYNSKSGDVDIVINKANATINLDGYTGVYDGNAHGASGTATGVKDEDLSGLLHLGGSFTDAPGGQANWTFDGNTNYNADSGSVAIVINKADADIKVNGYTGIYDGDAHGATGTATGVKGESLNSLLHFGDSFTKVPGGTANWTFDGNTNYNSANGTANIVINPWTLKGFYQPVDMGDVLNTVKNGSTVPVKFELFSGTTELTSASAVSSVTTKEVSCAAFTGDPEDAIEAVATGGTSLRYDATGGQFIYNWQTPKKPGTCHNLTMTATDGSKIAAYFKLK